MTGLKDLWASERGAFCIVIALAATLLAWQQRIDGRQWLDFMKYLTVALVAGKTIEKFAPPVVDIPSATDVSK